MVDADKLRAAFPDTTVFKDPNIVAIFKAASMALAPSEAKKTRRGPPGMVWFNMRARAIAGGCDMLPRMLCCRNCACFWMARTMGGWLWPRLQHHHEEMAYK